MTVQSSINPPWCQSFADFVRDTVIIDVHQTDNGGHTLGKAMCPDGSSSAQQADALMAAFADKKELATDLFGRFTSQLARTTGPFDALFVAGHPLGVKHILLNAMLVRPADLLRRVYDTEIAMAIAEGESVFVPESDVDPREALLARRLKAESRATQAQSL